MASSPSMPPPPGQDSGAPPSAPTAPAAASPSPAQPGGMDQTTQLVINVAQMLRAIAKSVPGAAPAITQINDLLRQVQMAVMQHSKPGEPAAPPSNG